MDVAEQIVVMNDGRIEQTGTATDLYEHPANEFVMGFVGPVNRLGDTWVRPHDIDVLLQPNGYTEAATVDRIVPLGFEVRVEFTLTDGRHIYVQLTRGDAEELELKEGQGVHLRPTRTRVFNEGD